MPNININSGAKKVTQKKIEKVVSEKIAKTNVPKATVEATESAIPSAETLRAYAGIDQVIDFSKSQVKDINNLKIIGQNGIN